MELSCTRVLLPDQSCIDTYNRLDIQIVELDERILLLGELQSLLATITDSSTCMIRLDNDDDRRDYPDCTDRDDTLEGIPEEIEMLQFFSLRDARAVMSLRNAVSADSILFESDISLYGDWTLGQPTDNRAIIRNNLDDEREDEDRGYDLGVESLLYINHFIDFDSVNRTSYQIADSIKEVLCRENNLQGENSSRVQVLLREFSLLEGNRTICPDLQTVSNARYVQADSDLGYDQASIYDSHVIDDQYISSTYAAEDEATLRFTYQPSDEVIEPSNIREQYDLAEQYDPADSLPNSLIDRVDAETIAESEDLDMTQEERIEQVEEEQEYVDEVQQQWVDEAQNYENEQGNLDDTLDHDQDDYDQNQDRIDEMEEEAEDLTEINQQVQESIEQINELEEIADNQINEATEQGEEQVNEEVQQITQEENGVTAPSVEQVQESE